jgi:hypothetical protein
MTANIKRNFVFLLVEVHKPILENHYRNIPGHTVATRQLGQNNIK